MTRLLYSSLVFFTLVHSACKSAGAQTAPAFRFEFKAPPMTAPYVLNEWTHGDLLHIHLLAVSHIQFSSLYQRSERFSKEGLQFVPADYTLQDGMESYNWMARYLLKFLDAYLKHDPAATQFITQTPIRNGVPKHLVSVSLRRALVQQGQNDQAPKDARRP